MKKILYTVLIIVSLGFIRSVYALPYYSQTQSLVPGVTDKYNIGTTSPSTLEYNNIYTKNINISGSCTGCGGSGSGNVATSSSETSGYVPFWTSTGATPATLGSNSNFVWNNTSGFLGIATTSPYKPLSVVGNGGVVAESYLATSTTATSTFAGGFTVQTNAFVVQSSLKSVAVGTTSPNIQSAAVGNHVLTVQGDTNLLNGQLELASGGVNLTDSFGIGAIRFYNGNNLMSRIVGRTIGTAGTSGAIGFNTTNAGSDTEKMRLTEAGNLGINTTAPSFKLHVTSANVSDTQTLGGASGGFNVSNVNPLYGMQFGVLSNGNGWIQEGRNDASATAYDLLLQSLGGNVGIGNASPVTLLANTSTTVDDGNTANPASGLTWLVNTLGPVETLYNADNSTSASGLLVKTLNTAAGTAGSSYIINAVSGTGASGGTSRFYVRADGNVGVGTTSPYATLSVVGTMALTAPTAFVSGDSAVCWRATGTITVDSGVSSCIVSSKTVKHDIVNDTVINALARISKLTPVTFEYNGTNKKDIGLIAEDVANVDPRYAQYSDKTGKPAAINWSAITADLVKVVQNQQKEIDDMKLQIKQLKK